MRVAFAQTWWLPRQWNSYNNSIAVNDYFDVLNRSDIFVAVAFWQCSEQSIYRGWNSEGDRGRCWRCRWAGTFGASKYASWEEFLEIVGHQSWREESLAFDLAPWGLNDSPTRMKICPKQFWMGGKWVSHFSRRLVPSLICHIPRFFRFSKCYFDIVWPAYRTVDMTVALQGQRQPTGWGSQDWQHSDKVWLMSIQTLRPVGQFGHMWPRRLQYYARTLHFADWASFFQQFFSTPVSHAALCRVHLP